MCYIIVWINVQLLLFDYKKYTLKSKNTQPMVIESIASDTGQRDFAGLLEAGKPPSAGASTN
jgi:hypothetical protein